MRVLMFGWELPPYNSGGLGVACLGMAKGLCELGVEIVFVLPKKVSVKCPFMEILFADEYLMGFKTKFINSYGEKYNMNYRDIYWQVMQYGAGVAKIIEREKGKCDLVHGHDWLSFGAAMRAKKTLGKPMIAQIHSTEYDRTGGLGTEDQIIMAMERQGMHIADRVVAVSGYTKKQVEQKYGIGSGKVRVVYNGIDSINDLNVSSQALGLMKFGFQLVLFVGRVTLQKGPDYFVKVAAGVLKYCPKTVFIIAGNGDMQEQVVNMVAQMGLGERILFAGFTRGEELARLYRSADVYVMPSVSEPFGIVALEALNFGAPVVMSKQSGVSEVVGSALKSDFWDINNMVNQIVGILKYPAVKKTLIKEGKNEAQKMSWRNMAIKMLDVYKEVTG